MWIINGSGVGVGRVEVGINLPLILTSLTERYKTGFYDMISLKKEKLRRIIPSWRVKNPNPEGSLTLEDGTDWLSRNVGKKLPLLAA